MAEKDALRLFFMETVKKTISLEIMETQNPKRKNLTHIISDLKYRLKKFPIKTSISHIRVENKERAKHRLKLKTASPFIKDLLIMKSSRTIMEKKSRAKPAPKRRFEIENSKVKQDDVEPRNSKVKR